MIVFFSTTDCVFSTNACVFSDKRLCFLITIFFPWHFIHPFFPRTNRHDRFVVLPPLLDGALCPPLNESKACNVMPCAIEGIPFGGEEDEVHIDNMENEIDTTPTVVDQTEVVELAKQGEIDFFSLLFIFFKFNRSIMKD